ncbi:Zn-dependent hydrolase, partial [Salmonella enterica subsp. enterica]|nr:Zn-dependent hydrolase [Salmonella enterica subsp. enterica]
GATYANLTPDYRPTAMRTGASAGTVEITYAGHSTYLIESPAGVRIATDFSAVYGAEFHPRVATMNKAHRTHYTMTPPPGIDHVLHGWGDNGTPAQIGLQVDDVLVRNVTTDIRNWDGEMERDGNSIFIFEVADLCIGHLGHLHTKLSDQQFGKIGRLDILMVPIDGGLTQNIGAMSDIAKRLYSSVILPMHRHSMTIGEFTDLMGKDFAVDYRGGRSLRVSVDTLPRQPTIIVLDGV